MRYLIVLAVSLVQSGCMSTAEMTSRLQTMHIGKPISDRISANGPPETVVRISQTQKAYTFVKRLSGVSGGNTTVTPTMGGSIITSQPVSSYSLECRVTFVVDAPQDNMPEYQMIIRDVRDMRGDC